MSYSETSETRFILRFEFLKLAIRRERKSGDLDDCSLQLMRKVWMMVRGKN
jgi:hypothetical protein